MQPRPREDVVEATTMMRAGRAKRRREFNSTWRTVSKQIVGAAKGMRKFHLNILVLVYQIQDIHSIRDQDSSLTVSTHEHMYPKWLYFAVLHLPAIFFQVVQLSPQHILVHSRAIEPPRLVHRNKSRLLNHLQGIL